MNSLRKHILKHGRTIFVAICLWASQATFAQLDSYAFRKGQSFESASGLHYKILSTLGKGGYGEVYKVRVVETGEVKALKWIYQKNIMPKSYNFNSDHLMKIEVVPLRIGKDITPVEVMDIGEPLSEIAKELPDVSLEATVELAGKVLSDMYEALRDLSRSGYVHNDLRPDNILYFKNKFVLSDYDTLQLKLAPSQKTYGSPHFHSPEQTKEVPTNLYSDYYNLGLTLMDILGADISSNENTSLEAVTNTKAQTFFKLLLLGDFSPKGRETLLKVIDFINASTHIDIRERVMAIAMHFKKYPVVKGTRCQMYFN